MKKILRCFSVILLTLTFGACSLNSEQDIDSNVVSLEEKYPGYYMVYSNDTDTVSVTNYHPYEFKNMPDYQEVVSYGVDAGDENEGTVYSIYIIDINAAKQDEDKYYFAEFEPETMSVLSEDDQYFDDEDERESVKNKLIEIINYAKDCCKK